MRTLLRSAIRTKGISKAMSFPPAGLLAAIIALGCMGFIAHFGLPDWQPIVNQGSKLASAVSSIFTKKAGPGNQEAFPETGKEEEESKKTEQAGAPEAGRWGKYLETAAKGEGLTHLARRALRSYLKDRPLPFLTPEHKIYIEDYLAKKKGGGWLELGQKVEFSQDLIREAIEMSEQLTPSQLENLKQYSQLVPSLNY